MKVARVVVLVIAILPIWITACKAPARTSPNLRTSFGTLAEVERRVAPDPSNPAISPKSGQVAYFLTFRGNIIIPDYKEGWEKRAPLVDSQGREFVPVLAGTPGIDGKLSQDNWELKGEMTAPADGRWVFKGSATVSEGVLVLAYLVPANARGFTLRDGATNHPLGVD